MQQGRVDEVVGLDRSPSRIVLKRCKLLTFLLLSLILSKYLIRLLGLSLRKLSGRNVLGLLIELLRLDLFQLGWILVILLRLLLLLWLLISQLNLLWLVLLNLSKLEALVR